jgi:hypothetical protein
VIGANAKQVNSILPSERSLRVYKGVRGPLERKTSAWRTHLPYAGGFPARVEDIMSARTIYLSRLIGLYCILVAPSLAIHKQATVDSITAMFHDPGMMMLLGIIALACGIAIILAHNIWSGGVLPVVVTLVGWLSLVKGLMFLLLCHATEEKCILGCLNHPGLFYVFLAPSFLIGVYLTWEGFRARAKS